MATTNFQSGTVIASAWLNDVNGVTYNKTFPDGTVALSAAPGTTLDAQFVSYEQGGTGSASTTVQAKLRESISLLDFIPDGTNTSTTDCSAYIQAALDSVGNNVIIYGGGQNYLCKSGIIIRGYGTNGIGGYKRLDMENGSLTFQSTTSIIGVTIQPYTLNSLNYQEYYCGIHNATINMAGVGGTTAIGVLMTGKTINVDNRNLLIEDATGAGYYVQGGVISTTNFNSPDKGRHDHITCYGCLAGFVWTNTSIYGIMTGHVLTHCYVASCTNNAFTFQGCAEFSMIGLNGEGGGTNGLYIDDQGYGGGHVISGAFVEGYSTASFTYINPNPVNSNIVLAKGSFGPANSSTVLQTAPCISLGFGGGLVINQEKVPAWSFNTTSPQLLSTNSSGCLATIMGRGGAYATVYFGNNYNARVTGGSFVTNTTYVINTIGSTDFTAIGAASNTVGIMFTATGAGSGTGTASPMFTEITTQLSTNSLFSTTKGTSGKVNVYPDTVSSVPGLYLQNLLTTGIGFGSTVVGGVSILNMS